VAYHADFPPARGLPTALPRIKIAQFWHERYLDAGRRWLRSLSFDLYSRTAR
jgi:hypothetical protein